MGSWKSKLLFFFSFFLIGLEMVRGGELTFIASVDKQRLSLDEELTLTVTVSGKDVGSITEPEPPSLEGFQVVGRNSSTSSQFQFINGRMSSSKTINFIYYLQPIKVGELKIGSFKLKVRGKTYQTDPITVKVTRSVGGATKSPHPTAPQISSGEVPSGRGNLFLSASYSPREVYVGEQVTATYLLCTREDLTNVQYGQLPSNTGFWTEDIYQAKALNFHPQVINGMRYDVAKIREVALFPTTTGELRISPMELLCDVSVRSRDFFDFWERTKRVRIRSNPGKIKVLPLPTEGKPEEFAGAVGNFTLHSEVDKDRVALGNPVNLIVTIRGTGNLRLITTPALPPLEGFKRYEPEVEEKISKVDSRIGGRKIFKYVLIPKREGELTIGPICLPYFDPQAKCYRQARSKPISLKVTPGEEEKPVTALPLSREVKLLGKDVRYIKPDLPKLADQGRRVYKTPSYIVLHLLPLLAIFFSLAYRKHQLRINQDLGYARQRRAKGLIQRRLKVAKGLLKEGSSGEFYGAIAKALTDYIGDKLNIEATGLTIDQLIDQLRERGYPSEVRKKFATCFENCDLARFSPSNLSAKEMEETLRLAQEAIWTMEKTTKQGEKVG